MKQITSIMLLAIISISFGYYPIAHAEDNKLLLAYQNTEQKFELYYPKNWTLTPRNVPSGVFIEIQGGRFGLTISSSDTSCVNDYGSDALARQNGCKSIDSYSGASYKFLKLKTDPGIGVFDAVYDSFRSLSSNNPSPQTVNSTPPSNSKLNSTSSKTTTSKPKQTPTKPQPKISTSSPTKSASVSQNSPTQTQTNVESKKVDNPPSPKVLAAHATTSAKKDNFYSILVLVIIFGIGINFIAWRPLRKRLVRR